jgi:hypothetical protein
MSKKNKRGASVAVPIGTARGVGDQCWEFSPWQECIALLPYRIGTKAVAAGAGYAGNDVAAEVEFGRPIPISGVAVRLRLYEALLEVPKLEPEIRRAVLNVLDRGAQAENTDFERGRTLAWRHMVDELAAHKHAAGMTKGFRTAAIVEVAEQAGLEFETLKRRLERLRDTI